MIFSDDNSEEIVLKSGIPIRVSAFPSKLWQKFHAQAQEKYPPPEVPKKKVKTVDGYEEIDDITNPEYLKLDSDQEDKRSDFLGTAILEICVHIDLGLYEHIISKLERYDPDDLYPEDPIDRKTKFLIDYAFVNAGDYSKVTYSALAQMTITEGEVAEKIKFFRSQMEQPANNGTQASGIDAIESMAVSTEAEGT